MKFKKRLANASQSTATPQTVTHKSARNWEESISLEPTTIEHAYHVDDVVRVLKNSDSYPSPIRAVGSRHSTTHCAVCDGGTLLVMRHMNQILSIDEKNLTVTTQAGALYLDVAQALRDQDLQFYVNVEIGNLTMGSAASTGTKDASMPDEFGQVCSYASAIKLVKPDGTVMVITEQDADLMQAARSSYGLMGVIVEVTFRIKAIQAMSVRHKTYSLDEFEAALPELLKNGESMMYYLFPFQDSITVEFRHYLPDLKPTNRWVWWLRNLMWKSLAPSLSHFLTVNLNNKKLRFFLIDSFNRVLQVCADWVLSSRRTCSSDQLIRYPEQKGYSKYTFSIWAFPEDKIVPTMRAYYQFCRNYYDKHGFRCDMLNVGYRIKQDTNPLFSYSYSHSVMTLDPVATAHEAGWDDFLRAYNEFSSMYDGVPLFNQSKWLTQSQVKKAFGDRVERFDSYRKEYDPSNRLLNKYFDELFGCSVAKSRDLPDIEQNIDFFEEKIASGF